MKREPPKYVSERCQTVSITPEFIREMVGYEQMRDAVESAIRQVENDCSVVAWVEEPNKRGIQYRVQIVRTKDADSGVLSYAKSSLLHYIDDYEDMR